MDDLDELAKATQYVPVHRVASSATPSRHKVEVRMTHGAGGGGVSLLVVLGSMLLFLLCVAVAWFLLDKGIAEKELYDATHKVDDISKPFPRFEIVPPRPPPDDGRGSIFDRANAATPSQSYPRFETVDAALDVKMSTVVGGLKVVVKNRGSRIVANAMIIITAERVDHPEARLVVQNLRPGDATYDVIDAGGPNGAILMRDHPSVRVDHGSFAN